MTHAAFAPRSLLYVPGSNARALEKAGGLAADMLIIDLEDAVPAERKAEARAAMRAAVTAGFAGKRVAVRVNASGSAEQAEDIAALDGLVLDAPLVERIKTQIRANTTPRHVPAKIVQVSDIPRTKSNKIVELAVRDIVHGREVKNREALANPEALEQYRDLAELKT